MILGGGEVEYNIQEYEWEYLYVKWKCGSSEIEQFFKHKVSGGILFALFRIRYSFGMVEKSTKRYRYNSDYSCIFLNKNIKNFSSDSFKNTFNFSKF